MLAERVKQLKDWIGYVIDFVARCWYPLCACEVLLSASSVIKHLPHSYRKRLSITRCEVRLATARLFAEVPLHIGSKTWLPVTCISGH